ncbi:MAG: hypothetical protein PHP08_00720 [Candidatus Dojkabacteria bacterium]|nr:hypothetical protein [Candidatus Dojkabacteria bacterium]
MDLTSEKLKLRNRIVTKGRSEVDKHIREGNYLEWLKKEYGVMDMDDILLDEDFLNGMKNEIERNRQKILVYDYDFKRHYLDEWVRKRDRKVMLREISERAKEKKRSQINEDIE